jgi:hypothetical protein
VVANYDLPWNPMIVEQRIGRVQRLASEHAHVSIFNITLQGTFEEYIVGRLMEKLQMASNAIGDIESLLQGPDVGDGEDDSTRSFQDRVLALVLAALAGKDVKKATEMEMQSIEDAKVELEREEANINSMLGSMDGTGYVGPRAPDLPPPSRSMDVREFTLRAFQMVGAKVTPLDSDIFVAEESAAREFVAFEPQPANGRRVTLYTDTAPAFQRLVKRVIASGYHNVADRDQGATTQNEALAKRWANDIGAELQSIKVKSVRRAFNGEALLRVRATVAHDSYERIVSCLCSPEDHVQEGKPELLKPLARTIDDPALVGLNVEHLVSSAAEDEAVGEFCRFYLERREQEVASAGDDKRKQRKLEDDFTPRLEITLAGLEGAMRRDVVLAARYSVAGGPPYEAQLTVRPSDDVIVEAPATDLCTVTGKTVPQDALDRCSMTGATAMRHLLSTSEISGRVALPEFATVCSFSGKRVLTDETEASAVTGKPVATALLMTSAVSGKHAEPIYFGKCAFTGVDALKEELATSQVSGKPYRNDEGSQSAVSGKAGHTSEFVECFETRQLISRDEAERCEITGKLVREGVLQACAETGKNVLPSELGRCSETGAQVLKSLLVTSSISHKTVLQRLALKASTGNYCAPSETIICFWSGKPTHPDDIRQCALTGLSVHVEFTTPHPTRLRPLAEVLDGTRRTADARDLWSEIAERFAAALKIKRCQIEAAVLSPSQMYLALCSEVRTLLGMRVHHAGAIYDLADRSIIGRVAEGRRIGSRWASS